MLLLLLLLLPTVPAEGDPSADGDSTDGDYDSDCPDDEQDDSSHSEALNNEHMHLHPTVLTVFSAPNYCDRYGNKAAVLHIEAGGYYTVNLLECEVSWYCYYCYVTAAAAAAVFV
jgi:hypothetical protein